MADADDKAPKKAPRKTSPPRKAAKKAAPKKAAAKKKTTASRKAAPKKAAPKKAAKKTAPGKAAKKKPSSPRSKTGAINPREAAAKVSTTGAAAAHAAKTAAPPPSEEKQKLRAAVRDVISKNEPQPPPHEKHLRLRVDENLSRGQDTVKARAIEKLFNRIEEVRAEREENYDDRILGMAPLVAVTVFMCGVVLLGAGVVKIRQVRKEARENAPPAEVVQASGGATAQAGQPAANTGGVPPSRFVPKPAEPVRANDRFEEVSEQPEDAIVLSFPTNRNMGEIFVRARGLSAGSAGWTPAGKATGNVTIQRNQEIQLKLGAEAIIDLSPLERIPADLVKEIYVESPGLTDAQAPHIKRFSGLQLLRMANCRIGDTTLAALSEMKELSILNLAKTQITDKGLASLSGLTGLRRLAIQENSLTDAALDHLAGLKGLQMIWVNDTGITAAGQEKLKKAIPDLVFSK